MGGGSYSYAVRRITNSQQYSNTVNREEIFTQHKISKDMDIKNKIRECKFSSEHPNAFPIILALDVTGSMGHIPDNLIRTGLPDIMEKIITSGVKDPQICFVAIGDQYTDEAPIQVGQFESSDDLMDKWLKTVWLEGRGGGNSGESYQLAWYFALKHTLCDWINQGNKGVLITIGDEPVHKSINANEQTALFNSEQTHESITTKKLLEQVQKSWDVYHINVTDFSGLTQITQDCWNQLLQDHCINTENSSGVDIPNLISGIILSSYKNMSSINLIPNTESTHLL